MLMRCTYCPNVSRSSSIASSTESAFCGHSGRIRQAQTTSPDTVSAVQGLQREAAVQAAASPCGKAGQTLNSEPYPHGLCALDRGAALVHGLHFLQLDGAEQLVQVEGLLGLQCTVGQRNWTAASFCPTQPRVRVGHQHGCNIRTCSYAAETMPQHVQTAGDTGLQPFSSSHHRGARPTATTTYWCRLQAVASADHAAAAAAAGARARQMVRQPLVPCLANALQQQGCLQ